MLHGMLQFHRFRIPHMYHASCTMYSPCILSCIYIDVQHRSRVVRKAALSFFAKCTAGELMHTCMHVQTRAHACAHCSFKYTWSLCIVGAHIRIDARAHVHTHVHTHVLTDYARGECRCQPLKECCLLEQCAPSKEVLARRARATHRVDDWPPRRYGGRCPEGSSSTPAIEQQRG